MTDIVAWQSMLNQVREERNCLRAQLSAAQAALRNGLAFREAVRCCCDCDATNGDEFADAARAALEPKP